VNFLGFPDGKLGSCHAAAVGSVLAILRRHRPSEVFVPYEVDGTPDHEATYQIVVEAVRQAGVALRLFEYPVWFWNQWPWVPFNFACNRETLHTIWRMLRAGFGLGFFKEFRAGVFVGGVLQKKREALAQHRSQMTILKPGVAWPTLADVSGGEFLNCFFQEFELFRCRDTGPSLVRDQREVGSAACAR
jgi:LmbE family N-acetylglucosaminyl deacetylase